MKPVEITLRMTSDVIEVSADKLWDIIGPGFADVGAWTSSVDRSQGRGEPEFAGAPCGERTCHVNISGYDQMTERMTHYDASNRELIYKVTEGVPGFVLLARNHWTLREVGENQSVAEMTCTLRLTPWMGMLLGWMMKWQVRRSLQQVFRELKTYAETGELSIQKKKRLSVLARSSAA